MPLCVSFYFGVPILLTRNLFPPLGLWSLKYNPVAAHAIYCVTMIDASVKETAAKFISHRRSQSGKFVLQTPSRLDKYADVEEKEIDSDLKMDRVFFEAFSEGDTFVVENTIRKQGASAGSLWDGPGYIAVAKDGWIPDLAKQICEDISAKHIIGHDCEEAAYRCGANSAVSHVQLGEFMRMIVYDEQGFQSISQHSLFH